MGNNQAGGVHKRERTGEGRGRAVSVGYAPGAGNTLSTGSGGSSNPNHHRTTTGDDGCPVQVGFYITLLNITKDL